MPEDAIAGAVTLTGGVICGAIHCSDALTVANAGSDFQSGDCRVGERLLPSIISVLARDGAALQYFAEPRCPAAGSDESELPGCDVAISRSNQGLPDSACTNCTDSLAGAVCKRSMPDADMLAGVAGSGNGARVCGW